MALTIYDATAGETREMTQADLDELLVVRASHGRIMSFLAEERTRAMGEIQAVRARYTPVDQEVRNV